MKKILAIVMSLGFVTCSFTSCGNDESKTSSGSDVSSLESSETTEQPQITTTAESEHENAESEASESGGGVVNKDSDSIDIEDNLFLDNTKSELTDNDLKRIDNALKSTGFPTNQSRSMKTVIDDTFKGYSISGSMTASDSSVGYYEYNVVISGSYYSNTAAKNSNQISNGTIHYTILYIQDKVSVCSVAVDDIGGDVYNAMAYILLGM